jgi:2-iminobutanoate/2-iminopropanoate deaminase
MKREVISGVGGTGDVPISPAIRVGDIVYCSGQIGTNPVTGDLVGPGIKEQTEQVLENLKTVLERTGSSLEKVDKCLVFLTDQRDYSTMNEVYRKYFPKDPPARSTVVVAALARPELVVEIECIGHV